MKIAKKRILIIEDNEISRTLLRTILRNAGYEVIGEARDGIAGLQMAEALLPDLICLDLVLPKLDGMKVLGSLRRDMPNANVLMVTGHADRDAVQTMIALGASGIVVKPFNAQKVLEAVERCLAEIRPRPSSDARP